MRRTSAAWLLVFLIALATPVGAETTTPLPLTPPPPDLRGLVPFAAAPIDKPPVTLPELALPPTPDELPTLPLARVEVPVDKPVAPIPPPRALPCAASWLGIAAERLECGRARYQKAEYEDAAKVLEQAVRSAADKDKELAREARYWLGETLWRLGRVDQADTLFRQVAQETPRQGLGVWAEHSSAWAALRRGNAARARDGFAPIVNASPPTLGTWARAGLAIALYELGQNDQSLATWADVRARTIPADLARDAAFWYGEALARSGDFARADAELDRFTRGGAHPLLDTGLLRLGWWRLAAGRFADAVPPLRTYVSAPQRGLGAPAPQERDWAEAGLGLALIATGDAAGAQTQLRALESRRSPLVTPVRIRMTRVTLEERKPAETRALVQDLLGATLSPRARAWVLLANAEAYRAESNRDDARTQYELAANADPTGPTAGYATFRLAQTNFEMREFTQAVNDAGRVAALPVAADMRTAAWLLRGEAAYAAGDYATAEAAFTRALADAAGTPQAPVARLSLAWTALRRGQGDTARRIFQEFAQAMPDDPRTPDALLLASDVALTAGDLEGGKQLLDRILTAYPQHPRAPFARLNRAIMLVRAGRVLEAQPELRDWITNTPFAPLLGRAYAALGVALLSANVPSEAAKEFTAARREGVSALAALGLGAVRLLERRWDDAAREFTEARDTGTPGVVVTAEYGLAVTAFQRGKPADFKAPAEAALAAAPRGPMAPRIIYVLAGIAVEDKDWKAALTNAKRLVSDFPNDEAADDALERVGAGAAAAAAWPVAYESYALLRQKYPKSPFVEASRLSYGLSEMETGRVKEARQDLEAFVTASPNDPRLGQALLALARAREAAGDRPAALEAYARAARDSGAQWSTDATLRHARLLAEERQWGQSRTVLDRLMKSDDTAVTAQAAAAIGQTYQGEGDQLAAAEYFMTAAYLDPESPTGRRALLGAAQSLAAVKQPAAAAVAYRKLLAQTDVPADLAETARKGLAALPPR